MQASDVMTTEVVSTNVDMPVPEVAKLLLEHGISAVPVLGPDGALVGMVSEGDLASRDELDRLARKDWWLRLLTGGAAPDSGLMTRLHATDRTAGDVMSRPVVSVSETTDIKEIARLLGDQHIKRVPVLKDGRVVGIVSRADLLRAIAAGPTDTKAAPSRQQGRGFLMNLFGEYHRPAWEVVPVGDPAAPSVSAPDAGPNAKNFRSLVERFHNDETQQRAALREAAAEQSKHRTAELLETHLTEDAWRDLLRHASDAAAAGAIEFLLLRFPNQLCTDGGRAIDVAEEGWPATLRGEAAEIYLRWERELKHRGFHLAAKILEYPDGKPGDVGLFLIWGE
jgi:CBS-domain-containing membrane protein